MINIKEFLGLAYYSSELDQFLKHYDATHPTLSTSQRAEKEKYADIFALRDGIQPIIRKKKFWDNF